MGTGVTAITAILTMLAVILGTGIGGYVAYRLCCWDMDWKYANRVRSGWVSPALWTFFAILTALVLIVIVLVAIYA